MPNFIYQLPGDNLAPQMTFTVTSGGENPLYPATSLKDLDPANPLRLTSASGTVRIDAGSALRLDFMSFHNSNCPSITIQGNATDVWTTPSLSHVLSPLAMLPDGYFPDPWADLKAAFPVAANRTFRFWRLVLGTATSALVSLGEVWISPTIRYLERHPEPGARLTEVREGSIVRTQTRIPIRYDKGVTWRSWSGKVTKTQTGYEAFRLWWRACRGPFLPMVVVPNPGVNEAWFATFMEPEISYDRLGMNQYTIPFTLEEVSRGLAP